MCENVSYINFCVTKIYEINGKYKIAEKSKLRVIKKEMDKDIDTAERE